MCIRDRAGQCTADPRREQLQGVVTQYFRECYAVKRWELLPQFLHESYVAHTPAGDKALEGGVMQALLEAITADVDEMVVEAISFPAVSPEELAEAGISEDDRSGLCKSTVSLTCSRAAGSTLEHVTKLWRLTTEDPPRLLEAWPAVELEDEGW
eukprot:TRINITY_DN39113_c0_g1_i1.p1 TRINITY_DN39113_c0_g1~~TRINITY_DN39113_c0_g1_i1.p1  ORF type:complete len:154 (-),score=49.62 TRINITY_DN39113_c0_g1_i1:150-611(-)